MEKQRAALIAAVYDMDSSAIASDCRADAPGSDVEKNSGDGAAAVLISAMASVTIENSYILSKVIPLGTVCQLTTRAVSLTLFVSHYR